MFSVQEGRGDGALLLVRLDNSKAAHRWLALVGEAAAGVEQSSEEPWSNCGRGKRNRRLSPVVTSEHRDKGANPRGAATIGGRQHRDTLHAVSMATRNKAVCGTG
jgi:hypothetical protein